MKKIVLLQSSWSQVCSNNINCIILIRNSRDKNILFLLLQRKRKRGKNIDNRQESLTDNARSHQNWYNICHKVGFVMYTIILENICLKLNNICNLIKVRICQPSHILQMVIPSIVAACCIQIHTFNGLVAASNCFLERLRSFISNRQCLYR